MAFRWFERAYRLAPGYPMAAMTYATHLLERGDPAAATIFQRVADEFDIPEARLGLEAAWQRTGVPLPEPALVREANQRRAARNRGASGSVLFVTHADGGGVERAVNLAIENAAAQGRVAIVVKPSKDSPGTTEVRFGPAGPERRYRLPTQLDKLTADLAAAKPEYAEIHHMLGHPPDVADLPGRLGIPFDVHIHDYAFACPRIAMVDELGRYCGEPDLPGCEACVRARGTLLDETIEVGALRARSAELFARARGIFAPSSDAAKRMRRYFPRTVFQVQAFAATGTDAPAARPSAKNGVCRVCVAGSIGQHKGYDVLLACARDAAANRLPIEYIVAGDTIDDEALFETGHVFVTGTYRPDEGVDLIRRQDASLGFLPSVWPETWSFVLSELWSAGLQVAVFDIGAPAERVAATGRGFAMPLGLPPEATNRLFLRLVGL